MKTIITASATTARVVSMGENEEKLCTTVSMRERNSPGTLSIFNPKKSLSCVLAIMTAIPFVKPTTTGRGMNLTAVPKPVTPRISRRIPAIKVDINSPSTPYFAMMPKTTTTNAPVGPPIWVFDPPRAEITKPATIAQYRPASGGTPEAMAKAIARGSATRPTVMPERRSARNKRFVYDLRHTTDLGSQLFIVYFLSHPFSNRVVVLSWVLAIPRLAE